MVLRCSEQMPVLYLEIVQADTTEGLGSEPRLASGVAESFAYKSCGSSSLAESTLSRLAFACIICAPNRRTARGRWTDDLRDSDAAVFAQYV